MFVSASENYRILTEEKRESSFLYKPVASIAPAVLPTIMQEVDELELNNLELEAPLEKTKDSLD